MHWYHQQLFTAEKGGRMVFFGGGVRVFGKSLPLYPQDLFTAEQTAAGISFAKTHAFLIRFVLIKT